MVVLTFTGNTGVKSQHSQGYKFQENFKAFCDHTPNRSFLDIEVRSAGFKALLPDVQINVRQFYRHPETACIASSGFCGMSAQTSPELQEKSLQLFQNAITAQCCHPHPVTALTRQRALHDVCSTHSIQCMAEKLKHVAIHNSVYGRKIKM